MCFDRQLTPEVNDVFGSLSYNAYVVHPLNYKQLYYILMLREKIEYKILCTYVCVSIISDVTFINSKIYILNTAGRNWITCLMQL